MATNTVLPLATYSAGDKVLAPTAIADSVTSLQIAVQRCTTAAPTVWPNAGDTIFFDLQLSADGGATWTQWFNGGSGGGIASNPKTGELAWMYVQGPIAPGTGRQFKGTITLSAAIKTSATVTVI